MRAYVYRSWDGSLKITKELYSTVEHKAVDLAPGEYEQIRQHWNEETRQSRLRNLWED